jgi:hypothetical protein
MELKPVSSIFSPGDAVIYRNQPCHIVAIRASSIAGKIGQRDEVRYDIRTDSLDPESIIGSVAENQLKTS